MKTTFLTLAKFVLFVLVFWVCNFLHPPFKLIHIVSVTTEGTRAFYWDGVVLMVALLVLLLVIEALRKRLRTSAPWTLLAFVLAFALAAKWDFLTFTR